MEKKVLIEIFARREENGEAEDFEVVTCGKFSGDDSSYTVTYEELGDLEGCVTTLEVKNGETILLIRRGDFNSQMMFENKRKHNCIYQTPYGNMNMGIYTSFIRSEIKNGTGELSFEYTIDLNGAPTGKNRMELKLKEA